MSIAISLLRPLKPETFRDYVSISKTAANTLKFCTEILELSSGDHDYNVWLNFKYHVENEFDYCSQTDRDIVVVDTDSIEIKKLEGCHYLEDEYRAIAQLPVREFNKLKESIAYHIEQEMSDELLEEHYTRINKQK